MVPISRPTWARRHTILLKVEAMELELSETFVSDAVNSSSALITILKDYSVQELPHREHHSLASPPSAVQPLGRLECPLLCRLSFNWVHLRQYHVVEFHRLDERVCGSKDDIVSLFALLNMLKFQMEWNRRGTG